MPTKPTVNYIRSEYEEQILCVQYLDLLAHQGHKIKYTAIPNSTYTTSIRAKVKNKKQGLVAGFPDMAIIINDTLLFVELKREKSSPSELKPHQKEWIQALNEAGEYAYVCKGFVEFKELVGKIIEISKETKLK